MPEASNQITHRKLVEDSDSENAICCDLANHPVFAYSFFPTVRIFHLVLISRRGNFDEPEELAAKTRSLLPETKYEEQHGRHSPDSRR